MAPTRIANTAQGTARNLEYRCGTPGALFHPNTTAMNSTNDKIKGNWNQLKGKLKQQYANLTDNDLLYVEGKEDELHGRLQERLGKTKEEVDSLIDRLSEKESEKA